MTRAEKVAQAKALRDEGLLLREIAERLGLSSARRAHELLYDPDESNVRARKQKAGGACVDCGEPTAYDVGRPYERCRQCALDRMARTRRSQRVQRGLRMIALRHEGLLNHEIAARCDCSPAAVAGLLCRMARDGYEVPPPPYWSRAREAA